MQPQNDPVPFPYARRVMTMTEKRIHYRIDPNDEAITLKDINKMIQDIQRQHPNLDVFFDGDEYAVCSRPKKSKP